MQLELTPHQESIIAEALSGGRYQNASQVIDDALQLLKAKHVSAKPASVKTQTAVERLRRFGARLRLSLGPGDSLRDWINDGRR